MTKRCGQITFYFGLTVGLLAGWFLLPLALYESADQPLQFSHALHTGEDVGMDCESCHGFDQQGRFTGIPAVKICADCHDEQLGESEDESVLVKEYTSQNREIPWFAYARQPDNAYFPHAQHVRLAELPCQRCHGDHGQADKLRPYERNRLSGYSRDIWGRSLSGVFNEPCAGMKMSDCLDCHRERSIAESCLDCHK